MARLLLVDDDPDLILKQVHRVFDAAGHEVDSARTGEDGVRQAAARPPDAILLDLRLPDLSMLEVYQAIGRVAGQDVVVLITGESGTGKELVARAIYQHSARAQAPFLPINCAAIPDALLESELFGHEKGAFTGAERRRIGKFE